MTISLSDMRPEFIFLNRLRERGITNMLGAGPFLENEFDIKPAVARKVLTEWIRWVNEDPENLNR